MSGGKDGQTLLHEILPTAINWHLKVKYIEYNVGLTQNYCIPVSTQKLSSIQKLIRQIFGSYELNDQAHFWPCTPKNHWNNFLLSWICTTVHQFISSIHSWDTANFRVLWSYWPHPFLATSIQKFSDQLLIYVNLYQHAKN